MFYFVWFVTLQNSQQNVVYKLKNFLIPFQFIKKTSRASVVCVRISS